MARRSLLAIACLVLAAVLPTRSEAGALPSSDVLVPFFQLDLDGGARTTLVAISNHGVAPVDLRIGVFSNWGLEVLTTAATVAPDAVFTANLCDWLLRGELPDRTLSTAELAHVQAALWGAASPRDGLYYASLAEPGRAVGYVKFTMPAGHQDAVWGDYYIIDQPHHLLEGETLVNLDYGIDQQLPCPRHGIRFLESDAQTIGTELMVWTAGSVAAQDSPDVAAGSLLPLHFEIYAEDGELLEARDLRVIPVQLLDVSALDLPEHFGWFEIWSTVDSFVTAHVTWQDSLSLALHSYCLPEVGSGPGPAIGVEKRLNGVSTRRPPGPSYPIGAPLQWTYIVTNLGKVELANVTVTDGAGFTVHCPKATLVPHESMICTASSEAQACAQHNVATARGVDSTGLEVSDQDVGNYIGRPVTSIRVVKSTNGELARTPPGPSIRVGDPVTWTYLVTNTGIEELTDVHVSDDRGLVVTCPKTVLVPGESMTCTAAGTAIVGQYRNLATAEGTAICATTASGTDISHYLGWQPAAAITLKKFTNGLDADLEPGPSIPIGMVVLWTYQVTNIGEAVLTGVAVTDDRGVAVTCPKSTLAPGESMTCTASGVAAACQYVNVGAVRGTPPSGSPVVATDPSHYFGVHHAALHLTKSTEGLDANEPPGPAVAAGQAVHWTYTVTNSGDIPLTSVAVTDDRGVVVSCPKTTLAPAESMTCTASGVAVAGQYRNVGTAVGTPPCGPAVSDSDSSHYLGVRPAIALEKLVNGEDADTPPGPSFTVGTTLLWTYVVTNTGDIALTLVQVTDDHGLAVTCPKTMLAAGESMTCTASGTAAAGQYSNVGTATGTAAGGSAISAQDPCYYVGVTLGNQGCTPGYWKNHTSSWPPTGYSTSGHLHDVFTEVVHYPTISSASLLEALSFAGGSGAAGAAEILARAAVAALLNAAHPDVAYPRTTAQVIIDVNAALSSGSRDTMLALAAALDADNNLGCPLH